MAWGGTAVKPPKKDKIDKLHDAIVRVDESRISHKALVVLVADMTSIPKDQVCKVLEALPRLEASDYFR